MTEYKIEKGVPLPDRIGVGKPEIYGFSKMEIEDSIVATRKAVSAARCYGERNGVKFTSRKLSDGTYRIWRIA